jgi:DNA polymerase III epsilon subunit-like protein
MIVFDTETTGLLKPMSIPLSEQPEIIELGVLKLDDITLEETAAFNALVKPKGLPLPPKITEITGLRDEDLLLAKPFAAYFNTLADFMVGERTMVGHNLSFDVSMLTLELTRLDFMAKFPWPRNHWCTVEINKHRFLKWPTQDELYTHYFARKPSGAHRALADVRNLAQIVREMRKERLL